MYCIITNEQFNIQDSFPTITAWVSSCENKHRSKRVLGTCLASKQPQKNYLVAFFCTKKPLQVNLNHFPQHRT